MKKLSLFFLTMMLCVSAPSGAAEEGSISSTLSDSSTPSTGAIESLRCYQQYLPTLRDIRRVRESQQAWREREEVERSDVLMALGVENELLKRKSVKFSSVLDADCDDGSETEKNKIKALELVISVMGLQPEDRPDKKILEAISKVAVVAFGGYPEQQFEPNRRIRKKVKKRKKRRKKRRHRSRVLGNKQ